VTTTIGLRAATLGGVALVALVVALAVNHRHKSSTPLPQAAGQWYTAFAAPYTPSTKTKTGACGIKIGPNTTGVAHAVLPCGVKLYVQFNGKQVLTQVVDRGHMPPGREFDVTQSLAKLLGLEGTQRIQWRFAR
jgi:rare lipoprotein A (peptidoglycan hydrolase)